MRPILIPQQGRRSRSLPQQPQAATPGGGIALPALERAHEARPADVRLRKAGLAAAMVAATLAMWVASPLAWIFAGAQLSADGPSALVLASVIAGIALTTVPLIMALNALDAAYSGLAASPRHGAPRDRWLRSVGDSAERRDHRLVDTITVATVIVAWGALAIWFVFFAHMPFPAG